jgi:hypothetical protein
MNVQKVSFGGNYEVRCEKGTAEENSKKILARAKNLGMPCITGISSWPRHYDRINILTGKELQNFKDACRLFDKDSICGDVSEDVFDYYAQQPTRIRLNRFC